MIEVCVDASIGEASQLRPPKGPSLRLAARFPAASLRKKLSTASIGAPRRGPSAAVHCARLRCAVDLDLEKILRSGQSRRADGPDRQTHRRQAAAETHRGVSECRGDRERTSQPERGRNSTRRTSFVTVEATSCSTNSTRSWSAADIASPSASVLLRIASVGVEVERTCP